MPFDGTIFENAVAFSYLRFSTPEQALGNSTLRQLEGARKWAAEHNMPLDESMKDEGLSGYHGKHLSATAHLGNFLKRIERGEIPKGSFLIVEHLDRLDRGEVEDALARFIDIKKHVYIVTLMDGQIYGKGDHWSKLFIAIVSMATANEESAKKAVRTADNWKRVRGTTSALAPSWIKRDKAEFSLIPEKVEVVRRVCCDLMLRMGYEQAARVLNHDGVPTLGGRKLGRSEAVWDASAIASIVRNRKVVGEQSIGKYENGKRHDTGESVFGAYPAAISEAEWYAMQQAIDGRKKGTGTMDGRKTGQVTNLFGDIARCYECGNRMTVQTRGKGTHLYLACSMGKLRLKTERDGKPAQCSVTKYHRLDRIEEAVLGLFAEAALVNSEKTPDDPAMKLHAEMEALVAETARLEIEYDKLFDQYGLEPIGSPPRRALDKRADQIKANGAAVKKLESEVAAKRSAKPAGEQFIILRNLVEGLQGLPDAERIQARAKIATALPHVVSRLAVSREGNVGVVMMPGIVFKPQVAKVLGAAILEAVAKGDFFNPERCQITSITFPDVADQV